VVSARVAAVVYVKDAAASDSIKFAALVARVKACPQVASVTVIDKKEAWKRFKEQNDSAMLQAVDENPFPVSLELSLTEKSQSASAAEALSRELKQIDGIEDIAMSSEDINKLHYYRNVLLYVTGFFCLVLVLALHVMISNTIKLTIYARRELIRNMHFVGATTAYIKAPFILEGMLQGVVGGAIGALSLLLVKAVLGHFHLLWGPWYLTVLVFITIGALFGCIGSMSAVRRFLVS